MGLLQRMRITSSVLPGSKAADATLDESLPKSPQLDPQATVELEPAAALHQPQPAAPAAAAGEGRLAAQTNGARPANGAKAPANGHAAGRSRGASGRSGPRPPTGSTPTLQHRQQQSPARGAGHVRSSDSPSPARPPPPSPARGFGSGRRSTARSPAVSEKGSVEQGEWERGSAVAISADSRSNSGGALTEEAVTPVSRSSSRREATGDLALAPVARSRPPQTATGTAALSQAPLAQPAAAPDGFTTTLSPFAIASAATGPQLATPSSTANGAAPVAATAVYPPPAVQPAADRAAGQSLISQPGTTPAAPAALWPDLDEPPHAKMQSSAATAPAAMPPLPLPAEPAAAAAASGAQQLPKQKAAAARQPALDAKPKPRLSRFLSCCANRPVMEDDHPGDARAEASRKGAREGSSKGGTTAAASSSRHGGSAHLRTANGSNGVPDSPQRGRRSDRDPGTRSAKSGRSASPNRSASPSSPGRAPRPLAPNAERSRHREQEASERRRRRHHRSSSAASVSSSGSVRSSHSRRSSASAASLNVRGYNHVSPYDPEIGAPRPVLKRTNSNASSASRSSVAFSDNDGEPSALTASPQRRSGRRHHRVGSSGSLASMDSLGSVGSLHSLAEGEPSEAADADAWGGASPSHSSPVRPRRRIPSSASLDSLESASSYGSNLSDGSSRRDYRAVIKGMDRPLSPLRDAGALFRGDSLSSGSGSWSVTSSELGLGGEDGSSPGSARRHRRSGSGAMSPDAVPRARRSSASLFGGDLGSPPLSPVALAQRAGSSGSFPSPSDMVALSVTKAKASPGTQVQQMRQLWEKVRAMRADTQAQLATATQAAEEAKARRASGGLDDATPVSPRPDFARLQEQRSKLQRRLEKLGMQQVRLEQHIAEAATSQPGSAVPSPPSSWVAGRTAAAVNIKAGRGGGIGGSGIAPMPHAAGRGDEDMASVSSSHTASGGRRSSGRRVTFSPPDKGEKEPQEDNFLQVVDTVASLKQLLATHPAASPVRRRPDRSAGTPSASGRSTPSVAGSVSSARSAKFDYDTLGVRLASGRAGPPPPLANRSGSGRSRSRSGDNGSRTAAAAAAGAAATRGALAANGSSPSRHRASGGSAKSPSRAAKSPEPWNDDFNTAGD